MWRRAANSSGVHLLTQAGKQHWQQVPKPWFPPAYGIGQIKCPQAHLSPSGPHPGTEQ